MTPRATLLLLLVLPALACSQAPGHLETSRDAPAPAETSARFADVRRVVVVGDVHGAHSALVAVLSATGLIDSQSHWTGGTTHLVSLGDLVDRGPESRAVLDLMMRLQREAAAAGGRVHVVLGNHEVMNLIGDWRYLTAPDYAAFAAEETEAQRFAGFASLTPSGTLADAATIARFEQSYPLGYFARHVALSPSGPYGAWLLSLPAIVVINDTAFVHGGLPPLVATTSLDALNAAITTKLRRYLQLREYLENADVLPIGDMSRDLEYTQAALAAANAPARAEPAPDGAGADAEASEAAPAPVPLSAELEARIREFVELGNAPELGVDGPLWFRGSVYCKPLLERPILEAALAQLAIERVVVGHTPTDDRRARALYDGKLLMLDTGMLAAYYNGRPAALVVERDQQYVQYANPPERGTLEQGPTVEPYPFDETELSAALEHGTVTTFTGPEQGERARAHRDPASSSASANAGIARSTISSFAVSEIRNRPGDSNTAPGST